MAYTQKYNVNYSDDEIGDNDLDNSNDEMEVNIEKKAWDHNINSENFLNERAPPLERTNRIWLERGLQMPRLGENDSTNAKVYDPNAKKNIATKTKSSSYYIIVTFNKKSHFNNSYYKF